MKCYFEYIKANKKSIIRKFYIKSLAKVGRNSIIPFIRVKCLKLIGVKVGKSLFVGTDTYIDDTVPELIRIEDNVTISFRVIIIAHKETGVRGEAIVGPVVLKEKAFLGAGCIILPGVTIGKSAIVAAGAIVTKNVPDNSIIKGVH